VVTDYENNGRRSVDNIKRTFTHLEDHFGADCKAAGIDAAAIQVYKAARLKVAKPATVNRELASLKRGFRLAVRYQKLAVRPDFSLLTEKNARRGFFQHDQIADLLKHAPDWLAPLITFLFTTGWRRREATGLEWRQVDRKACVIRIEDTKTNTPRTIPYGALPVLFDVINGQWKKTEALKRAGAVCPYVFHRDGRKILDFREVWHEACRKAGLPGRIVHDFRRSAAREMVRAGIPQNVAMMIGGWKTDSVFRRYAIVDENLLAENLAKLAVAR
jgi:integrase